MVMVSHHQLRRTRRITRKNILIVFILLTATAIYLTTIIFYQQQQQNRAPSNIHYHHGFLQVNQQFFIYSAYIHQNMGDWRVSVIGAAHNNYLNTTPICVVRGQGASETTVTGQILTLEQNNFQHKSVVVICTIPPHLAPSLEEIAIRPPHDEPHPHAGEDNYLPIQRQRTSGGGGVGLVVCVRPTYNFDSPLHLAEFVEMYRLLGATHITLYNHSIGPNTLKLIRRYEEVGVVRLLHWDQLWTKDNKDFFEVGQVAAQNDCLHRYRGEADFLAFVDLDEFIMPRGREVGDLLRWLRAAPNDIQEFRFQNSFYLPPKSGGGVGLRVVEWRQRLEVNPLALMRVKYVVREGGVGRVGVHSADELKSGGKSWTVPDVEVVLAHYRAVDGDSSHRAELDGGDGGVEDEEASNRWGEELQDRVERILKSVHEG